MKAVRQYFEQRRPAGVVSAYLFGSAGRGEAHRESDVDIAVVMDYAAVPHTGARQRLGYQLAADLIAATHRNEVDVVVLNDAPPELAATAVTEGERIYCADQALDHSFVRTVLLRRADLLPFLERTRRLKLQALRR